MAKSEINTRIIGSGYQTVVRERYDVVMATIANARQPHRRLVELTSACGQRVSIDPICVLLIEEIGNVS